MRIMQLIDSLRPGGAERMALNYFLALKEVGHESFIVVSREEGLLADQIKLNPNYHFLKKSNAFDFGAFYKLKKIISINEIEVIQAHSSSWFWAVLCKISGSKIKVVWHDHYGNSEYLDSRNSQLLKKFSNYFDGIISVNEKLMTWAKESLGFRKPLIYLPNFVNQSALEKRELLGNSKFKIACVANLRPQKDHLTLITAFNLIQDKYDVSLHLFGRNFEDDYFSQIKNLIINNPAIFYYGEVNSAQDFLSYADVGVLSSKSEGLPLALLEYGMAGIPVISTRVGECSRIIENNGGLVQVNNPEELAKAIEFYLKNPDIAKQDSVNFQRSIEKLYSKRCVLSQYFKFMARI